MKLFSVSLIIYIIFAGYVVHSRDRDNLSLRSQVSSLTQERDQCKEKNEYLNKHLEDVKKQQESRLNDPKFQIALIAKEYDFPVKTALRIAHCESKTGTQMVNKQGSSAEGIFMFMPRTFNFYCDGEIENNVDQIKCFIKLYRDNKSWWECS